ncbi:hypothetical protein X777_05361 [Ooceraea biroi]|uniref:Uncharacterized protein n=1 Tax=Ooceraea biroi TaxID=2015173 RepID=A0A026WHI9_OOCBI|nr:hypothetical protein X777_05361 [Ooceraea biroi]
MNIYRERKLEERRRKVEESKSTKEYKRWKTEGRARYLDQKGKGRKIKTIARFRCGNKWKGNRYWEEESRKTYRLCGEKEET